MYKNYLESMIKMQTLGPTLSFRLRSGLCVAQALTWLFLGLHTETCGASHVGLGCLIRYSLTDSPVSSPHLFQSTFYTVVRLISSQHCF